MSGSMNVEVKRLKAALSQRGSMANRDVKYSPPKHSSKTEKGYEARVSDIAKKTSTIQVRDIERRCIGVPLNVQ